MKLKLIAASLLLAGQGALAADAGLATAVLVDQELGQVHQLSARPLDLVYADMSAQMPGMGAIPSSGNIAADAVGYAIAGLIVNAGADEAAQTRVDQQLQALHAQVGADGLQPVLRAAFADAFAGLGLEQRALAFTGASRLDPKLFTRMPAARGSERFVFVRAGDLGDGAFPMPVAMHDSQRQLRVALDIEVRRGDIARQSKLSRRDVAWYSDPLPVGTEQSPLEAWMADDLARLRAELGAAVAGSVALSALEREFPRVAKDAIVGVVGELGLEEFNGVVLENVDGRALIWTRGGSLVSIPCLHIVEGDALVAARVVEEQRRAASGTAPDASTADKGGDGKTAPTLAEKTAVDAAVAPAPAVDTAPAAAAGTDGGE